jgi:hypothetical protein
MKKDHFLFGFLIGIALLILATLLLFIQRRSHEVYLRNDLPENVIHNYVLALESGDFERAYSYLADGEAKPSFEMFSAPFHDTRLNINFEGIEIGFSTQTASQAHVPVYLVAMERGLFTSFRRQADFAELERVNGVWKITRMSYPYWEFEWLYTPAPAPPLTTPIPTP